MEKNYKTKDGTCVRDYIHVYDLADMHTKGISYLKKTKIFHFKLWLWKAYSVKQIVDIYKKIKKNTEIKYQERRARDVAQVYANIKKFNKIFKVETKI